MLSIEPEALRVGLRVVDARGALVGAVKRVVTRDTLLRRPHAPLRDLPPDEDFPFLVVEARDHLPLTHPYCGYFLPCSVIVAVDDSTVRLSAIRADLDNLGWDTRPHFLS